MEVVKCSEERKIRIAKGEIFMKMGENPTYEECVRTPDRHFKNIIVDVASSLIAQWAFTGTIASVPDHIKGIMVLAVGTGDPSWDLQNPPSETAAQTLLENELIRKTFSDKTYVDGSGFPTLTRTNVIDFSTTFLEAEAVGPLVEMGLFGGNGPELTPSVPDSTATDGGTMINYKTFAVINKPSTSKLIFVWRLTF